MKYKVNVIEVGSNVNDMLQTGLLILFNKKAPEDLKPYCLITEDNTKTGEIEQGDTLIMGNYNYTITAVGEQANTNLYSLGHVSLCFDSAQEPNLPGHIHLSPEFKNNLTDIKKIVIE